MKTVNKRLSQRIDELGVTRGAVRGVGERSRREELARGVGSVKETRTVGKPKDRTVNKFLCHSINEQGLPEALSESSAREVVEMSRRGKSAARETETFGNPKQKKVNK